MNPKVIALFTSAVVFSTLLLAYRSNAKAPSLLPPQLPPPLTPLDACILKVSRSPNPPEFEWKRWNAAAETKKLIEEAGGLTPTMKMWMDDMETPKNGRFGSGFGSIARLIPRTVCLMSDVIQGTFNVSLLVDFPCGDQQWMPMVRERNPNLLYVGVDVNPGVVQRNRELFGNKRTEFFLMDMSTTDVFRRLSEVSHLWKNATQRGAKIAIMSRHVIQHLELKKSLSFIRNVKRTPAELLFTTTFNSSSNPGQTKDGGFAPLNLHLPPFLFGQGVMSWREMDTHTRPIMEVFEVKKLPDL